MSRYNWNRWGGLTPSNHEERKRRDAFEAAHPDHRRSREAFNAMADKVSKFLDIPTKLPERALTPAEKEGYRRIKQLYNLREHVRWRSLVHQFQTQPPLIAVVLL